MIFHIKRRESEKIYKDAEDVEAALVLGEKSTGKSMTDIRLPCYQN